MPLKVLKHVFSRYAPVKLGLPLSRSELAWMWRWYRACNPGTYLACRTQLQRLAFYTRTRLHQITADRQLDYDRSDGYMVLLRSQSDSDMVLVGIRPTQGGADGHRPTRGTFASLRTRASSAHPKPERKSPVHNEAIHSPAPS